jgi:hypothetical protein
VRITYRFGPQLRRAPEREPQDQRVHVVSNSLEFGNLLVPLVSVVAGLVVDEF